jgi:thioredoxin reductase (NADPH)
MTYVETVNQGKRVVPTSVFPAGSILVEPSSAELSEKLGLATKASRILQDKVATRDDMTVITNHAVQEFVVENGRLSAVRVLNRETGELKEWHVDAVFEFVGMAPNSEFLTAEIEQDRYGFVVSDSSLQTSTQGIIAAGDVRAGATAQAAAAVGEGATAALMIRQYLESVSV